MTLDHALAHRFNEIHFPEHLVPNREDMEEFFEHGGCLYVTETESTQTVALIPTNGLSITVLGK